jgi:hypothetical protein
VCHKDSDKYLSCYKYLDNANRYNAKIPKNFPLHYAGKVVLKGEYGAPATNKYFMSILHNFIYFAYIEIKELYIINMTILLND